MVHGGLLDVRRLTLVSLKSRYGEAGIKRTFITPKCSSNRSVSTRCSLELQFRNIRAAYILYYWYSLGEVGEIDSDIAVYRFVPTRNESNKTVLTTRRIKYGIHGWWRWAKLLQQ